MTSPDNTAERTAPRVVAIDLGRGAAVAVMVIVHTLWMYGSPATQESSYGAFVHFLGKGTPMFLLAMGFSYMLSRRQTLARSARRGLYILAVGYAMNVLKFIVPIEVFGTMPETFIEAYGWSSPLSSSQLLYLVGTGDILQLAGLALIVMGVVRRYVQSPAGLLVLSFVTAAASGPLHGYRPGIPLIDGLSDLLWGAEWNVYFPVVPWIAVIFFGMALGTAYLRSSSDPEPVFRRMLPLGAALATGGAWLCYVDPDLHLRDFFHLGPGGAVHLMGVSAMLFWFAHRTRNFWTKNALGRFFQSCSHRVTSLYVVHWVAICWGMGIVGYHELDVGGVVIASAIVLAVSMGVDKTLRQVVHRLRHVVATARPTRTSPTGSPTAATTR